MTMSCFCSSLLVLPRLPSSTQSIQSREVDCLRLIPSVSGQIKRNDHANVCSQPPLPPTLLPSLNLRLRPRICITKPATNPALVFFFFILLPRCRCFSSVPSMHRLFELFVGCTVFTTSVSTMARQHRADDKKESYKQINLTSSGILRKCPGLGGDGDTNLCVFWAAVGSGLPCRSQPASDFRFPVIGPVLGDGCFLVPGGSSVAIVPKVAHVFHRRLCHRPLP